MTIFASVLQKLFLQRSDTPVSNLIELIHLLIQDSIRQFLQTQNVDMLFPEQRMIELILVCYVYFFFLFQCLRWQDSLDESKHIRCVKYAMSHKAEIADQITQICIGAMHDFCYLPVCECISQEVVLCFSEFISKAEHIENVIWVYCGYLDHSDNPCVLILSIL